MAFLVSMGDTWCGLSPWEVSINGGTPMPGWFIMEHPTKMDDLGVSPLQETSN